MIVLVDYGAGNLRSVAKALAAVGARVQVSDRPADLLAAEKIILPGVGAFGDGMDGLQTRGLVAPLKTALAQGKPLLGICLGMQLLFANSEETPETAGLGVLPGVVRRFPANLQTPDGVKLKIPHTGWNQINPQRPSPLLHGIPEGAYAYFNHGYYCQPAKARHTLATTTYGRRFAAVVGHGSVYGVQFHPEKSQQIGLQILRNFVERCS